MHGFKESCKQYYGHRTLGSCFQWSWVSCNLLDFWAAGDRIKKAITILPRKRLPFAIWSRLQLDNQPDISGMSWGKCVLCRSLLCIRIISSFRSWQLLIALFVGYNLVGWYHAAQFLLNVRENWMSLNERHPLILKREYSSTYMIWTSKAVSFWKPSCGVPSSD